MIITINNLERNTADGAVITVHWNARLEANLQAQIDEQKTPTTVLGTPWQEVAIEV
jgi:hypothetical protein